MIRGGGARAANVNVQVHVETTTTKPQTQNTNDKSNKRDNTEYVSHKFCAWLRPQLDMSGVKSKRTRVSSQGAHTSVDEWLDVSIVSRVFVVCRVRERDQGETRIMDIVVA
jgi:hypothetical protein